MKPSERIKQIFKEVCAEQNDDPTSLNSFPLYVKSIEMYLDEEWRRKLCNEGLHEPEVIGENRDMTRCKYCAGLLSIHPLR